jgi:FkbH-like protein
MSLDSRQRLFQFLSELFGPAPDTAIEIVERVADEGQWSPSDRAMLRLAALHAPNRMLSFYRLHNAWASGGRLPLKPAVSERRVWWLADFTVSQMVPLVEIMSAARGVHLTIDLADFDSVEQEILGAESSTYAESRDLVVVSLSAQWLHRFFKPDVLVEDATVSRVIGVLDTLLSTLTARTAATILITNFGAPPLAYPAAQVVSANRLGWNAALARVNDWLASRAGSRVAVVDAAGALFEAGGRESIGLTNYFRAKIPFEPAGMVALSRELASAIASLSGKTHRALLTDCDNTLWGGEVAEAGANGVVCGQDSPEALGYYWVQEYVKGLGGLGVLRAAVSRNDPSVQSVFRENTDLRLTLDDFTVTEFSFGAKSEAVDRIAAAMGFGAEFMVFLDDSLFDIAEVLVAHPGVDVVRAGPEPEDTLRWLTASRLFNAVSVTAEDGARATAARALSQQRALQAETGSLEEFLRQIRMRVTVSGLTDANLSRVEQLFQKTNQFNVTTKRYIAAQLRSAEERGARLGVFAYEDVFGPQGIISAVILEPGEGVWRIDSWLMSCRVLNRTVEDAVFAWVLQETDGTPIEGEYRPTPKNRLIQDLYSRFGFRLLSRSASDGAELWRRDEHSSPVPAHFIELVGDARG